MLNVVNDAIDCDGGNRRANKDFDAAMVVRSAFGGMRCSDVIGCDSSVPGGVGVAAVPAAGVDGDVEGTTDNDAINDAVSDDMSRFRRARKLNVAPPPAVGGNPVDDHDDDDVNDGAAAASPPAIDVQDEFEGAAAERLLDAEDGTVDAGACEDGGMALDDPASKLNAVVTVGGMERCAGGTLVRRGCCCCC